MIVSNLTVGQIIPNYKIFCEILSEPVYTNATQKKRQIDNWSCYFNFIKIQHTKQYRILEIYTEEESQRKISISNSGVIGNNSIYIKYIEIILLQFLSQQGGQEANITRTEAFRLLGFTNKNYNNYKYEQELINKMSDLCEATEFLSHTKSVATQRFNLILFSALSNLSRRKLIKYRPELHLVLSDGSDVTANKDQEVYILSLEREAMLSLGYEFINQVYQNNKGAEYKSIVKSKIQKQCGAIDYYHSINILYYHKGILERLEDSYIELNKVKLNELTCSALYTTFENNINRFNSNIKEEQKSGLVFGERPRESTDTYYYNSNYFPDNYTALCEVIVKSLFTYISEEVL